MRKNTQKKTREKDFRQSLTLHLSARQGDLLKEILSEELENARSNETNIKVWEVTEILTAVQDALNLAEHFMEMRNLTEKEK